MYAMFVAVAFRSQFLKAVYAVLNDADVDTVNRVPFAFRRPNPFMMVRHVTVPVSCWLSMLWPFLLLQKPRVRPPVEAGLQTLPKETLGLLDMQASSVIVLLLVAVVAIQFPTVEAA